MCPAGSAPQVVAYEFDGRGVEWVSCTDETGYRSLLPVADGVVYVATYSQGVPSNVTALDAATGEPIDDAPPPPPARGTVDGQPNIGQRARVEVGDITVVGGQDVGVRANLADGILWSQPGVFAYDDVWAVDDGAVFAFERETSRLVAYEVDSGDVRWFHEGDPYREGLWPFYAVDGRVYTLWSNLQVRSTADGELQWRTDYPAEEMEAVGLRMTGVDTDGDERVRVVRDGGLRRRLSRSTSRPTGPDQSPRSSANAVSSSSASSGVKPPAPRQRTWPDPSTRRSAIVDRSSMPSGRVTRLTSP